MSTFLNLAVEIAVLIGLALLYYFYQRHRILHGPRQWRKHKLTELHAMALSCATPDEFPELHPFLDEIEERMKNNRELDQAFLANWRERPLPENLKHLLHECWEWSTYQA